MEMWRDEKSCSIALRCKVLGISFSIPLLATLILPRVGVLVSKLVRISAAWLVGLKPLPVGAPLDVVVVCDWPLKPLLEVVSAAFPAKDIRKVLAASFRQLDKEARIGSVHRGGVRGGNGDCLHHRLVCGYIRPRRQFESRSDVIPLNRQSAFCHCATPLLLAKLT